MQKIKDITPENMARLEKEIDGCTSACIITHIRPDGDALGSALGMYLFLTGLGKSCKVVLPSAIPETLDFVFSSLDDVIVAGEDAPGKEAEEAVSGADVIFALDFHACSRIGSLGDLLAGAKAPKVLIDHHRDPETSIYKVVFSDPSMSSTAEYLYHILMATSFVAEDSRNLSLECATALFTGMTTDTNNFSNSVIPSTMLMATDLLGRGVDRDAILEKIYNRYSEGRLRLMGHVLSDLMTISESGVSVIMLTAADLAKYHIKDGETEGFVNLPLAIEKVKVSFFLKQDTDCYRVSIRSKGVKVNICSNLYFNGGGHFRAAGGRLDISMSPKEAVAYTFEKAEAFLKDTENE